jgi:hypothetical protein
MKRISKKGNCIRNVINFSKQKPYHKMDKSSFNPKKFNDDIFEASPKLDTLIQNIQKLDESDVKNYGEVYKHLIYTDVKSSSSGAKMIAAGLLSKGYKNAYDSKLSIDIKSLEDNEFNNFALLCSVPIYNKPFSTKLRRNIISLYNERPNNINGKYIRIIILDQGFKEGIDLFDVKYVHLFEPLLTKSDEKQAIGRATRFCGQQGLTFDPNTGWALHVYKYETIMNERQKTKYNIETSMELFMRESGLDISKLIFANELETISRYGAIDYELNKRVHDFGNEDKKLEPKYIPSDDSLKTVIGMPYNITASSLKLLDADIDDEYYGYRKLRTNKFALADKVIDPLKIKGGGIKGKKKKGLNIFFEKAPQRKINFLEMRKFIKDRYNKYKWDEIKFENKCNDNKKELTDLQNDRIMKFTPTQEFISRYFNKESKYKGLLLWHSVGTGKTCSAIATATRGFEPHGYTILWVTRHTLKPDIWKNIFGNVCSLTLQRKIKNKEFLPSGIVKTPLKYLSNSWITPISYKQFSNMLLEKNQIYKEMKKRNGSSDPLKKTIVIIDEVHKLYANDLPIAERPNMKILKEKIKNSYKISGDDSVRLLLMTATPYTSNPMDLIKMINLMKDDEEITEDFDEFKKEYLNDQNMFSDKGSKLYLDSISGYISYLNRERDARQFAYPVFYNIDAYMSEINNKELNKYEDINQKLESILIENENKYKELMTIKDIDKEYKKKLKIELTNVIKEIKLRIKDNKKSITKEKNKKMSGLSQEEALDECLNK